MTYSKNKPTKAPMEAWILPEDYDGCQISRKPSGPYGDHYHFIEHSAYQALKEENKRLFLIAANLQLDNKDLEAELAKLKGGDL